MQRIRLQQILTAAWLATQAGLTGPMLADETKATGGPQVDFQTAYLAAPIGRAHQIRVSVQLGGYGTLTLDPNTCTATQFGDTGVCTEISPRRVPVRAVQLRLADPTGQGRRLFRLTSEEQTLEEQYFLVVPRRRSQTHRLIVDLANDNRRVVTLEAVPPPPAGKPELCANAEYSAVASDGKVVITAKGEHPTAGWKVAFEQLPIRIFPPQHRLVCVRPGGVVAQVITPFEATATFKSDGAVREVVVHDTRGPHRIPVKEP